MNSFASFCRRHHARIVNRMISMNASEPLSLPDILPRLPDTARYNRARPCRIYWRFEGRIPVQLFPKGTIQVLGRHATIAASERIRDFFMTHLSLSLSPPRVNSCTVACRLAPRLFHLNALPSNHYVSNEYELFPGTLIRRPTQDRRRRCVHICLFSNGTVVVTGVTSLQHAYRQLKYCLRDYPIL